MNFRMIFLLSVGLSLTFCAFSREKTYPVLSSHVNVRQPALLLNGVWEFQFSPQDRWTTIQVPGEAAMQGYAVEHDKPFRYRKSFTLPSDYRGKTVILRFDGVYSYARLWINGAYVREHHGGFTRWETDVTSFVKPGRKNEIELEVTDRRDDISYASGYAHHPVGGILRDVTVFALPETHVYDFRVETHLDSLYRNAVLKVAYSAEGVGEIEFALVSPDGRAMSLPQNRFPLSGESDVTRAFFLQEPQKWDAEHPNLYTLTATIYNPAGREVGRFSRQAGFREVKIVKNQLLVNGKPVKLRGACRHDMHPTLGRMTTAELDSLDAVLFKQANMNFVRTSHYPSSERFAAYCDQLGIYVESETAVCFVDTHTHPNYDLSSDTAYAERCLSQFQEMVNTFRSHPSVLFWSLGNESVYGANFQQCRDWVAVADTMRPALFSYPGLQKEGGKIYDILSMHYPDVRGNLLQYDMLTLGFQGHGIPALFDEWAHVPCYTYATLRDDPNIRAFWGESLDRMWANLFEAQGGLGGAIWGYVDEIFMLPEPKAGNAWWKTYAKRSNEEYSGNCVGYGEWGIIDIWRRKKPEFWSTKKAYSPVRLLTCRVTDFTPGKPLLLPVHNRFDHTNLNEVVTSCLYRGIEKTLEPASIITPHQKGLLSIPAEDWQEGDTLFIEFHGLRNAPDLIDRYAVVLGEERKWIFPQPLIFAPLKVEETGEFVIVRGKDFEIPFSKATGLITGATSNGEKVIEQGPFLNLDVDQKTLPETAWKKTAFTWKQSGEQVEIALSGVYGEVKADLRMLIGSDGRLQADYVASGEPSGRLREAGLKFYLPPSIRRLSWLRKGYRDGYPDESFAGHTGDVDLYETRQPAYGERPTQPWHLDTHNYYYFGDTGTDRLRPLTQQAKGMKEHCFLYTLVTETGQGTVFVHSQDASVACRVNKTAQEQLVLYVNNRWDYPEIGWGNYSKNLDPSPCYGRLTLCLQ
ncbi:MAG: beta-galactosidase [Tannerella sp.]|nr:beta-galactosidase [Tannerella sp.]